MTDAVGSAHEIIINGRPLIAQDGGAPFVMIFLILVSAALVLGFRSLVAALLPYSALDQWLQLHAIAVGLGVFLSAVALMVIAYLRDDGMVD